MAYRSCGSAGVGPAHGGDSSDRLRHVPDAVAAMRDGACDYLVKPVSFEQLEQAAERILPGPDAAEAMKDLADTPPRGSGPSTARARPPPAMPTC